MAEPVKKDDALAAAVREAFQRHMENARLASAVKKPAPLASDPKLQPIRIAANLDTPPPEPEARIEVRAPEPELSEPEVPLPSLPRADELPPLPGLTEPLSIFEGDPEAGEKPFLELSPIAGSRPEAGGREVALHAEPVREIDPPSIPDLRAEDRPLVPPAPANDRDTRLQAARLRELERRAAIAPPVEGEIRRPPSQGQVRLPSRGKARKEAANVNAHFGRGSRYEPKKRKSGRWKAVLGVAVVTLLCIGVGGYIWLISDGRDLRSTIVGAANLPALSTGQDAPAAQDTSPAASPTITVARTTPVEPAAAPEPAPAVTAPEAAAPATTAPAATPGEEDPVMARPVKTVPITLDAIDLAVQDSRERMAQGDVAAARLILERFRDGGDPRALFALAETFDPGIVRRPEFADPAQAQELYEAAGRAGATASAERLAKLQVQRND